MQTTLLSTPQEMATHIQYYKKYYNMTSLITKFEQLKIQTRLSLI